VKERIGIRPLQAKNGAGKEIQPIHQQQQHNNKKTTTSTTTRETT